MSALIIIAVVCFILFGSVSNGLSLHGAGAIFAAALLFVGVPWVIGAIADHRERKRINADAFLREVVAAHQRANEARQATERA